ncbi:MAG TPA: cytochrome c3 family protein, partial [Rhodothermia bacterium]|nr:cytochrome c3 family protein [Rhodothermia bacterium]
MLPLGGLTRLALMVAFMLSTLGLVWYQSVSGLAADKDPVELIFSHRLHVEDQDLDCSDCHGGVAGSEMGTDNLLPEMAVCADCHDVENEDECGTCHSNVDDPREVPRIETFSTMFSHKRHIDADVACEDCHSGIAQIELASAEVLPGMVKCLDCHDQHAVTSVECSLCHAPSDRLAPLSHGPDFIRAHSDIARTNAPVNGDKTCQTCHDVNYCQDCHEGDNLDRLSHP